MRKIKAYGLVLGGVFLAATPASADDDLDELLDPFRDCGEIEDGAARLACFDTALAGADARIAAQTERRRRRTVEDFGLSATQIEERYERERDRAQRSGDADALAAAEELAPEEPNEVSSPIAETFTDETRRRVFLLENGQIWREGSNGTLRGRIRVGSVATISRGGIGGYRLRVEGRTGFMSVSRVR